MRPNPWETLPARFAAKIAQNGDCWEWTGGKTANGYGHISIGQGVCRVAHRVSYELHVGPIPDGFQIDHLCRNRGCVNPNHLEAVTPQENVLRSESPSALNATKKLCVRGHLLDGENLRMDGAKRVCKECRRIRQLEARSLTKGSGPGSGSYQRGKTHCPQGHPYDEANTYVSKQGNRACKTCQRQRNASKRRAA